MDRFSSTTRRGGRRGRTRRWDETDAALLALIRLALDDSWSAEAAAGEMAMRVPDQSVLRRVRVRVENAVAERPTPVALRALRTLDALLGPRDSSSGLVRF